MDESLKGGVALLEEDGTFSVVCPVCWQDFTNAPPGKRRIDTIFRSKAEQQHIATDPSRLFERFDPERSFIENVVLFNEVLAS